MKTFIKKIVLIFSSLLVSIPSFAYDFEVDGIYYIVTSLTDMTCGVTRGANKYEGSVSIPSDVTYNSRNIKVTSIDPHAFYGCSSLTSVTIPNSVTSIGSGAFQSCSSLTSVTIPNSVTSIGESAFELCRSLTSVTIPNSVTYIELNVFNRCSSLTSVTIPNSVTYIGSGAFQSCSSLTSVTIQNSDSVTSIGAYAFSLCSSLTSVTIPNSVTSIGSGAFSRCSSLTSVTIPNSVTSIGEMAFYGCSSLKHIKLSESLNTIPYGLFNGCKSLESLEIPGSVNRIVQYYRDNFTFSDTNLENLYINFSAKPLEVGYKPEGYAFTSEDWDSSWTKKIKELLIDRELKKAIPVPNLAKLKIGESVKKVQISGISLIETLDTIYSFAKVPPTLPSMSNKQYMNTIVKVPDEFLESYKSAESWCNFWNISAMNSSGIIENKIDASMEIIGRYDINGKPVDDNYNGILIIRYSDGSTRKYINKSTR